MKSSKLLIAAASILATLAGVEIFGQAQTSPDKPGVQPRYQISAAGDSSGIVFAIDTHSGKLWRYIPHKGAFEYVTEISEEKQNDTPPDPPSP